ncbi:hypothetical protein K3495_g10938 [Podosphaera aphanis]|nr:hypothetical protein K3495_g10938 [Podosphaera aphanis]
MKERFITFSNKAKKVESSGEESTESADGQAAAKAHFPPNSQFDSTHMPNLTPASTRPGQFIHIINPADGSHFFPSGCSGDLTVSEEVQKS